MTSLEAPPRDLCLLVEDHPKYCAYLEAVLMKTFPDLDLMVTRGYRETVEWLKNHSTLAARIRYALVDIGLPDGSGINLIQLFNDRDPAIRTIVSTVFMDDTNIFDALSAGAFGYILKSEQPDAFVQTLKRLVLDEPPLSPQIARRMLSHFQKPKLVDAKEVSLTPREKQTLSFLVQGLTVPESAEAMGISPQTVSGYVKLIYQKLHVSNRAEVTREAIQRGLV